MLLGWDALLLSVPDMLCGDVTNALGGLDEPLQILVKPMRPLVLPEEAHPDICIQHALYYHVWGSWRML